MKTSLHEEIQTWLIMGDPRNEADQTMLRNHLAVCAECRRFARQVSRLEERLPLEVEQPAFSNSFLKQKSMEVHSKIERRRMKAFSLNFLRLAGWAGLAAAVLALGLLTRAWLASSGETSAPAAQVEETSTPVVTPAVTAMLPMAIDPTLCEGQSLSASLPESEIAIDGGRVTVDGIVFEFWLTCSNSTDQYAMGTHPIERLGLHAYWIYPQPYGEDYISDSYGFAPRLSPVMVRSPISDGITTSSGAAGILSVAEEGGEVPEGIFVLPDLSEPARFNTKLETSQGTWSAAISFRLEAGAEGYRPVDVKVEALPFIKAESGKDTGLPDYPPAAMLGGAGVCFAEVIPPVSPGTGVFGWPFTPVGYDDVFHGLEIYSKEPSIAVMAVDDGVVTFAGQKQDGKWAVLIDHGNGYHTYYSLLGWVDVTCGEIVVKGQPLGRTWNSMEGEARSSIFFAVYDQGKPLDPLSILPAESQTESLEGVKPIAYPEAARLDGPGACPLDAIQTIHLGSGQFTWPLESFGIDQEFPGIHIYSTGLSEIVSAADRGTVTFAGLDEDGENVILVDHGNGYQTYYGRLGQVDVVCGDRVEKGQTIGRTFEPSDEENQSYLFFALYFNGLPVHPENFLQPGFNW
jgi:murein DD-endopeptidase MepM/ murein hydrolase activator NlpD/predicted anti-sigma-YlaC factor YlaD